jgi:Flp pilus assembly protein TadG
MTMKIYPVRRRPTVRASKGHPAEGLILVMMTLLLVVLMGLAGIVIDLGLMGVMARQAQNVADAGALAAARDLLSGKSAGSATATVTSFVATYNNLASASVAVYTPPTTGPYAGRSNYVEVTLQDSYTTAFAHFLPGVSQTQTVTGRAVAGYEAVSAGEGVAVLNPDARPGLQVANGGRIRVNGRVVVNSEGGGIDENGAAVSGTGVAAKGGNPQDGNGIFATDIRVVGGVDSLAGFLPYVTGDPSPLKARQTPEPDPLVELPVPTTGLGVDPTIRGGASVTGQNPTNIGTGNERVTTTSMSPAVAIGDPVANGLYTAQDGDVILYPGIYDSISIGNYAGRVLFVPGIFVISAKNANAMSITGGNILAAGVMFYNTGHNYNPANGNPDVNDNGAKPPISDGATLGGFTINDGMVFTPLNTAAFNYASMYAGAPTVSSKFDGMLFFQRRNSQQEIRIQGNSSSGVLKGTLYAKWANFSISGQGTYDAQFVAGSMSVTGSGAVTILSAGGGRGRANEVFLVE